MLNKSQVVGYHSNFSSHHPVHSRHCCGYVLKIYAFASYSEVYHDAVDGPIAQYFGFIIELSSFLVVRFVAVIIITPIFGVPGLLIAALGVWLGQIYMKAQLAVKREMSNARAPVLGHFGAAMAGLSTCH